MIDQRWRTSKFKNIQLSLFQQAAARMTIEQNWIETLASHGAPLLENIKRWNCRIELLGMVGFLSEAEQVEHQKAKEYFKKKLVEDKQCLLPTLRAIEGNQ